MQMPTFDQLIVPTIEALKALGGSGSVHEIAGQVLEQLDLPEDLATQLHNPEKSSRTEVEYRLAWARTYLKKVGFITNSERGIWTFTEAFQPDKPVDPSEVVTAVRMARKQASAVSAPVLCPDAVQEDELSEEAEPGWRQVLHQQLFHLEPAAFERLAMRILRESGFVQVEVTGKSGDGGIDGKGIVKIQNILSYHVVFQCKRYKDVVRSGDIRDFRGAMIGRADKGLFITTGRFTSDAVKEATRDGAPPIDLVDSEDLIEMMKDLRLGVTIRMVEEVFVDEGWFNTI